MEKARAFVDDRRAMSHAYRLLRNHIVADLAMMAAGGLMIYRGVSMLTGGGEVEATSFALLLFSIGLIGMRMKLGSHTGPIGKLGGLLAWVGAIASVVAVGYYLLWGAGEPGAPSRVYRVSVIGALGCAFLGSALLGAAFLRRAALPGPWRAGVASASLLWLPAAVVGWLVGADLSVLLLGVVWLVLGGLLAARSLTYVPPARTRTEED